MILIKKKSKVGCSNSVLNITKRLAKENDFSNKQEN